RSPLAVCVIGGLIVSTALTLVMIPITYTLFDSVVGWVSRKLGRGRGDTRTRILRKSAVSEFNE
ncbi:MAG: hypothetical protein M3Y56_09430, partial [Armatimonadota bacterium]|nr:hypothetical protein [Armatimonadota bacterium]